MDLTQGCWGRRRVDQNSRQQGSPGYERGIGPWPTVPGDVRDDQLLAGGYDKGFIREIAGRLDPNHVELAVALHAMAARGESWLQMYKPSRWHVQVSCLVRSEGLTRPRRVQEKNRRGDERVRSEATGHRCECVHAALPAVFISTMLRSLIDCLRGWSVAAHRVNNCSPTPVDLPLNQAARRPGRPEAWPFKPGGRSRVVAAVMAGCRPRPVGWVARTPRAMNVVATMPVHSRAQP